MCDGLSNVLTDALERIRRHGSRKDSGGWEKRRLCFLNVHRRGESRAIGNAQWPSVCCETPVSMSRADAGGEIVSFLAGNINEMFVSGKLIQGGEEFLRLDEQIAIVVLLNLEEHVIDAEAVVAHGAAKIGEIGLLARETFEDIEELLGVAVERVIESDGMRLGAVLILKGLLAEIGDFAVHFQVDSVEIVKFRGQGKDFLDDRGIDLHRLRTGIITELADVVRAGAGFGYLNFDELRIAGFEDFAKGDGGAGGRGRHGVRYGGKRQK